MKTDHSSFKIIELPVPIPGHESSTHLYVIQSDQTALVDTGPAATSGILINKLLEANLNPAQIDFVLCTHIHLDHLGGLSQALRAMPRAEVIVHPRGLPHLHKPEKLWQASLQISGQVARNYGQPEGVDAARLSAGRESQIIDLGGICLEVLYTPGHAAHHLSYFDRQFGNLFAGESAGVYFPDSGVSRPASPPPFDFAQTLSSLEKMIALQPERVYYCHYGASGSGLSVLQNYRRQLWLWHEVVSGYFSPDRILDDSLVEKIVDEVITRDGSRAFLMQLSEKRKAPEFYFLRNNVRGFWDYFRRAGSLV